MDEIPKEVESPKRYLTFESGGKWEKFKDKKQKFGIKPL